MGQRQDNLWWIASKPRPLATSRLFCFPYAGGNAATFRDWGLLLPSDVEVFGLQLPGRANRVRERAFTRLPDLVTQIGLALADLLDKRFACFGHSMGAVLAFEVARWLRRNRKSLPRHLFVAGRRAPQLPDIDPPKHKETEIDFVRSLKKLNGTPPEVLANEELLKLALPTLRADFEVVETYRYIEETPLPCPITMFGGKDDEETRGERLDAWRFQTSVGYSKYLLDGDHFFIRSDEAMLLRLLRNELSTMSGRDQL